MNENEKLRNLLSPLVEFAQSPIPENKRPLPTNPPHPSPQNSSKTEKKEPPKKRKKSPESKPKPKKTKKDTISIDDFI